MKISLFLVAILCVAIQAAPAPDDEYAAKETTVFRAADTSAEIGSSATLLPATNPANVVFRTIEASRPTAFAAPAPTRQYVFARQPAQVRVAPLSYFAPQPVIRYIHQQPAAPQVVTRVIQAAPAPVVPFSAAPIRTAEPEPYDPNPQYNFNYQINDGESNVFTGHKESRNGDEVTGEYSVMDPDGSLRITRYTAGPGGYNAEVEIQKGFGPVYQSAPVAQRPAIAAPAPAPVAFVAPKPVIKVEDSGEKVNAGFVDANVLNLGSTRFFQAPLRYSYFSDPNAQSYRYLNAGNQQFFSNPYSFVRTIAAPRAAPVSFTRSFQPAPQQQVASFPSGTTFTRIVRGDGTTIEY